MRHPRTTQERRRNEVDGCRPRRRRIPTYFDDLQPRPQRTWKKHRTTKCK